MLLWLDGGSSGVNVYEYGYGLLEANASLVFGEILGIFQFFDASTAICAPY